MTLFTVEELREVISAKVLASDGVSWAKQRIRGISLDTRSLQPGDLFLALQGDRFDGHDFVATAFSRGAVGAIVLDSYDVSGISLKRGSKRAQPFILGVRDPLHVYQQLAAHHRSRFHIPVVAVTGSNGKTTTKEMVASVMAHRWKILKTEGNLNNRVGVPQTLLRLNERHKGAVIEMGVDNLGQTTRLCEIVRPTIGVITNIGPDHLEFFGTMEVSAQAKAEMLDLLPSDGVAILNADDSYYDYLAARARCRVVSFGFSSKADVRAMSLKSDGRNGTIFRLLLPGTMRHAAVHIRVQGDHNVTNALAAGAVGSILGLSGGVIAQGLSRFRPAAMRSQVRVSQGVKLIIDCYNANPASMKAAVQLLAQTGAKRKRIAVLGDMLELGPNAAQMHEEVGGFVARHGIDQLVACGLLGRSLAKGAKQAGLDQAHILEVPDARAASAAIKAFVKPGDTVLIKASRGMKLELVADALRGATHTTRKAS
ncbi:MAG: UDP-N-acetylmuramoyl-tripeptide--D-alanyl-D-alanine ligase [Nitrospira sp. CG24B]|nr:MAG: UDP-N-acetylmuramoyl-tripeptide--D-alanyl-D-alanine ligase [Nitrospira sp. CG24B]